MVLLPAAEPSVPFSKAVVQTAASLVCALFSRLINVSDDPDPNRPIELNLVSLLKVVLPLDPVIPFIAVALEPALYSGQLTTLA